MDVSFSKDVCCVFLNPHKEGGTFVIHKPYGVHETHLQWVVLYVFTNKIEYL